MSDVTLHLGDCLDVLPTLAAGSVDAVVTDPPYFHVTGHHWDWSWSNVTEWARWCGQWAELALATLADNGSALICGDDKNTAYMQVELDRLPWSLLNNIVWSKTNYTALKADRDALNQFPVQAEERILFYGKDGSTLPMARYLRAERERAGVPAREIAKLFPSVTGGMTGCVSNWELGLNFPTAEQYSAIRARLNLDGGDYLRRQYDDLRRPFFGHHYTDVWDGPAIAGRDKEHPTQKPAWIAERMVMAISRPGDTVLDPFMGSGTTGVACMKLGRNFIGIERDPGYFAIAQRRIAAAQAQLTLPLFAPVTP